MIIVICSFRCDYSSKFWDYFKVLMRLDYVPNYLNIFSDDISSIPMSRSIWSIIQRLVLGDTVYFLWIERNSRTFQKKSRSVEDICSIIRDHVRLRLLSLKIKGSKHSSDAAKIWNFQVMEGNNSK